MGIETAIIASAVLSAAAAGQGYMQQRSAAKQQKNANRAAMQAAEEESRLVKEDAAYRAGIERKNAASVRSQQVAAFLKSGVTLDGSPLLVMNKTTADGEENANNLIRNAESQSRSMLLRGRAAQQPVQKADLLGAAAKIASAGQTAMSSMPSSQPNMSQRTTTTSSGNTITWNTDRKGRAY
jgi:hypothetical protein